MRARLDTPVRRRYRRRRAASICLVILGLAAPISPIAAAPATQPRTAASRPAGVGERIVAYCQQRKGRQVDNGECARLVLLALQAAGAKPRGKDDPNPGDYTWGTRVFMIDATAGGDGPPKTEGNPADLRPGDIVQFRDARFVRRVAGGRMTNTMTQHTAVVASVDGDTIHTLEQNVAGNRTVQDGALKLSDLKGGWLRFYRPLPADKRP